MGVPHEPNLLIKARSAQRLVAVPTSIATVSLDESRRTEFRQVEVRAVGQGVAGVDGIGEGAWVVTVGQHVLAMELQFAAGTEDGSASVDAEVQRATRARVRPVPWQRVLELQDLQDEELLEGFLDKQRKISAALFGVTCAPSARVVQTRDNMPRNKGGHS